MSNKGIEDKKYKLFFKNIDNKNSLSLNNINKVKISYDTIK